MYMRTIDVTWYFTKRFQFAQHKVVSDLSWRGLLQHIFKICFEHYMLIIRWHTFNVKIVENYRPTTYSSGLYLSSSRYSDRETRSKSKYDWHYCSLKIWNTTFKLFELVDTSESNIGIKKQSACDRISNISETLKRYMAMLGRKLFLKKGNKCLQSACVYMRANIVKVLVKIVILWVWTSSNGLYFKIPDTLNYCLKYCICIMNMRLCICGWML